MSSQANFWRGACISKSAGALVPVFAVAAFLVAAASPWAAGKPVTWRPIQQALLRIDDQPVKDWNVYQESKKADPLLLKANNRYLLIEVHDHKVFDLAPAQIEQKGDDVLWDPAGRPSQPLASSGWIIKDIGFAFRISFQIEAEKHNLDLQLPHPMDLRYIY